MARISPNVIGQLTKTSLADDTDPTPIVYMVDGETTIGTLATWANAQKQVFYGNADVSMTVWRIECDGWGPKLEPYKPRVTAHDSDDHEGYPAYRHYLVSLFNETASYKIDLRS